MTRLFHTRTRTRTSLAIAPALAALLTLAPAAQTRIEPHKNSYKPEQDVQLGREAAARGPSADAVPQRRARRRLRRADRRAPGRRHPARSSPAGVPLHVRGRQPEGDQRLRAAGRADVPQPRDDRGGQVRGRGRRRHGARDRHVALRHGTAQATKGQKFQIGAIAGQVPARSSAAPPARSSRRARSSASAPTS